MDNLLVGKTRKEASRMFFEALVCSSQVLLSSIRKIQNILRFHVVFLRFFSINYCTTALQVLKTKDYINVEQGSPFDNINIKPRVKLVKSEF